MGRKLTFRVHALRRMFKRQITPDVVEDVLDRGVVIEEYRMIRRIPVALCSAGTLRALYTLSSRTT